MRACVRHRAVVHRSDRSVHGGVILRSLPTLGTLRYAPLPLCAPRASAPLPRTVPLCRVGVEADAGVLLCRQLQLPGWLERDPVHTEGRAF